MNKKPILIIGVFIVVAGVYLMYQRDFFSSDDVGGNSVASSTMDELPLYTGRDVQEVRPDPEEVKLFNDEQKNKLYSDLRTIGEAVWENPGYFFGWIELGNAKKVIGDYEGARDAWEYAGEVRPENSLSFANLGELYWRYLPDFKRSEENFRASIKNKPDDLAVYVSFSDLYYYSYQDKAHLADDVLMEGIASNPEDNVNLMRALAGLYDRQGDMEHALEWWERVLEQEPEDTLVSERIEALKDKLSQ